jgi:hypothetical protein
MQDSKIQEGAQRLIFDLATVLLGQSPFLATTRPGIQIEYRVSSIRTMTFQVCIGSSATIDSKLESFTGASRRVLDYRMRTG